MAKIKLEFNQEGSIWRAEHKNQIGIFRVNFDEDTNAMRITLDHAYKFFCITSNLKEVTKEAIKFINRYK